MRAQTWVMVGTLTLTGLAGVSVGAIAGVLLAADSGTTYTVDEFQSTPWAFDPGRGDTVNVRMASGGDPTERCAHMGGRLDGLMCLDVDF